MILPGAATAVMRLPLAATARKLKSLAAGGGRGYSGGDVRAREKTVARQVAANCVIGAGSVFQGRLAVSGVLHIEGKFQGDVVTEGDVVVGPTGQAKTDINTGKVVVAGTFIGNIHASEEVYVTKSGKVLGSITTPKLTLEPGVVTSGNVTITSEQPDAVVDTVISAYGADAEESFAADGEPLRLGEPDDPLRHDAPLRQDEPLRQDDAWRRDEPPRRDEQE